MTEEVKFPALILKLAEEVSGQPLSFREEGKEIVIVFADGRKIRFVREEEILMPPAQLARSATLPAPVQETASADGKPIKKKKEK